jgi:hypothetical protein
VTTTDLADRARFVREQLPPGGLFADQHWRMAPEPFRLGPELAADIEKLGRVLLQFYRAVNLLYRHSIEGRQPAWVAELLDQGKPADLIALQRDPAFKNDVPRVIRPDLLLTENGLSVTELDSVPGGIGLTAWLNQTYSAVGQASSLSSELSLKADETGLPASSPVLGGARGMLDGFTCIFGDAQRVHLVVSDESATYRPEMEWIAAACGGSAKFQVQSSTFTKFDDGDAVYRFFELFDLANVPAAEAIFAAAREKRITLTPPPKSIFEEKALFALLWNRNLHEFWRQHLGEAFLRRMQQLVPYTWVVDPVPLPPHAAIPELNLTDWQQLKTLSQRERELILKVSGFSENAWGARGVYLGSDLSLPDWSAAVDAAIRGFGTSPHVLQRFTKPRTVAARWFDF